jgi:hypothetical protein
MCRKRGWQYSEVSRVEVPILPEHQHERIELEDDAETHEQVSDIKLDEPHVVQKRERIPDAERSAADKDGAKRAAR